MKSWLKYQQKIACFLYNATKFNLLCPATIYKNFIFMQKYAIEVRCYFLTFSLQGKLSKYDIYVKRKHTKTNENMIFSTLFTILFFMQCGLYLWLFLMHTLKIFDIYASVNHLLETQNVYSFHIYFNLPVYRIKR